MIVQTNEELEALKKIGRIVAEIRDTMSSCNETRYDNERNR